MTTSHHGASSSDAGRDVVLTLLDGASRDALARRAAEAGLATEALGAQLLAKALRQERSNAGAPAVDSAYGQLQQLLLPRLVHELRTPVGSLQMLAEILEAEAEGEDAPAARNAHRVRLLAADIQVVLEEIAELSALERGAVLLRSEPVPVAALVAELEHDHLSAAAESGVKLEVVVEPATPSVVHTDRERLKRVLALLLRGAIRAGVNERVEVRAGRREGAPGPCVAFSFSDRGSPLVPGTEHSVFAPFAVADSRTRRLHGGTSLALPIASSAARLLGGELTAASAAGVTTFTLLVPLRTDEARTRQV